MSYVKPNMDIVAVEVEDVIRTSTETPAPGVGGGDTPGLD